MKKKYDIYQQFYVCYVIKWGDGSFEFHNERFGLNSLIARSEEGLTDGEVAEALSEIASGCFEYAKEVVLLNWWAI